MKKLSVGILCATVILLSAGCSCTKSNKPINAAMHEITHTDEAVIVRNYFFNNNVATPDGKEEFIIRSQEEFDRYFSPAAFMGKNGDPTKTNFDKQIAICVVSEETNIDKRLDFIGIGTNDEGKIVFSYQLTVGQRMSYTIRPCLVVLVDKRKASFGVDFHKIFVR